MKTVAIIQGRMASSRLPDKILMDIEGKPMLAWVIDRARLAKRIDQVMVATTTDPSDDRVEAYCRAQGFLCYRGSMHDVLDRFYQAAKLAQADVVVRFTADCPLLDPELVDQVLEEFTRAGADFAANRLPPPFTRTYPIGLDTEVSTFAALERAWKEATEKHDREHVMPYLYEIEGRFKVIRVEYQQDLGWMRWTVDTAQDLELIRQVAKRLKDRSNFSWLDIVDIFRTEPKLAEINSDVQHRTMFDVDDALTKYFTDLTMIPTLTIFSAPKPFTNPHIRTIQRNAIQSWKALGPEVQVILIGLEEGMAETAIEFGVIHLPDVRRNSSGTPLVSSIFELARLACASPLLAYINADILVLPDFLESARQAAGLKSEFLLVGQRWDLDVRTPLDFDRGWLERLQTDLSARGRLHTRGGSDYFIFPRTCFQEIPDFAIGRAGWDNWMIYEARKRDWACVDATRSIRIIHQDHDYSHLPQGQAHYRLPETFENIRLAGGKRTIFTLMDTDFKLERGKIEPVQKNLRKLLRDAEIFPLIKIHSYGLAQLAYTILHPIRAYQDFRKWLRGSSRSTPRKAGDR